MQEDIDVKAKLELVKEYEFHSRSDASSRTTVFSLTSFDEPWVAHFLGLMALVLKLKTAA